MKTRLSVYALSALLLLLLASLCSAMGSAPETGEPAPTRNLMPSEVDPEYQELLRQRDAAVNSEERRRAEIAIERYCVRYTDPVPEISNEAH